MTKNITFVRLELWLAPQLLVKLPVWHPTSNQLLNWSKLLPVKKRCHLVIKPRRIITNPVSLSCIEHLSAHYFVFFGLQRDFFLVQSQFIAISVVPKWPIKLSPWRQHFRKDYSKGKQTFKTRQRYNTKSSIVQLYNKNTPTLDGHLICLTYTAKASYWFQLK